MRCLAPAAMILPLAAACGRADELDSKLSTDLINARFVVILWPPELGSATPALSQPAHTKCAMRLKDQTTGKLYILAKSVKDEPKEGTGDPSSWSEHGDYVVIRPDENSSGASHRVRIECGTWKVLGIVPKQGP